MSARETAGVMPAPVHTKITGEIDRRRVQEKWGKAKQDKTGGNGRGARKAGDPVKYSKRCERAREGE